MSQIRDRGRGKKASNTQLLRQDQYEFISKWYHVVVRSLVDMYQFKNDYKWLAKMVNPPITVNQAKQSISLLERLGLIAKQKDSHVEFQLSQVKNALMNMGVRNEKAVFINCNVDDSISGVSSSAMAIINKQR